MSSYTIIAQLNSKQKKPGTEHGQTCDTEWNKPDNLFDIVQPLFSKLKPNKQNLPRHKINQGLPKKHVS